MIEQEKVLGLGREWQWPAEDTKCRKVIFDWAVDVDKVLRHTDGRRMCVQAGGNMGVWPWLLAKKFARVYTFEADPRMFDFLVENLRGVENVQAYPVALFSRPGRCAIGQEPHEVTNLGAQFIKPDSREPGATDMATIDSFGFDQCDLIYLDIEGAELDALKGAKDTIAQCKPLIVVEDKGLSRRFGTAQGAIEAWLKQFGYKPVARYHRDTVFKAEGEG